MEKINTFEISPKKEGVFENQPETFSELKKEKNTEEEISEIDQQISETERLLEKEKKEIAERRANLGLREMGEESLSMKFYREKINNLTARKTALEKDIGIADKIKSDEENKTKKEKTTAEKIKPQEFDDFIATTKKLTSFFQERDSQRLDRLIDNPERIRGAISSLESSLSSQKPDTEGAGRAISRIAEIIGELGEKQAQGAARESSESLAKLAFLLTNIDKERYALGGGISKKENAPDILPSLSRIESRIQNKKTSIYQKLDMLKRYSGH